MSVKVKKIGDSANNRIMVRLDTTKLDQIEKELGKNFVAQIGILGVKAGGRLLIKKEAVGGKSGNRKVPVVQKDSDLSNADLGLIHEKGSPARGIPRRSFLEVPLTTKMPGMMAKVGQLILKGLEASNIAIAYEKLAAIGEIVVHQAFPTSGYGTWPSLKKGSTEIGGYGRAGGAPSHLIDTGQLRQSISSRVVTK